MTSQLKNELLFGTRALLRDNPFSRLPLRALRRNESLTREQLDRLQDTLLHRTLQTAIARLPFYAHIARDFPVSAAREVLQTRFPVIDKATLLAHRDSLYPRRGHARPWQALGKTSGTAGTPLTIVRSAQSLLMEQAFIRRHWAPHALAARPVRMRAGVPR